MITTKQQELLTYLEKTLQKTDKIPSLREIGEVLRCTHTNVSLQLKELERKGFIKREGRYSRTITLYPETPEADVPIKRVPIIGQVTAGLPMYAQEEWEGSVVLDPQLFPGDNLFCLRIKGESMRDAGILHGDLVVCEPRQYANDGEIVVALVHNEEATVKYFRKHDDSIELVPANDNFSPVRYGFSDILVQGKVKGVVRDSVID